jgi:UDP-GlcNAc3NAcA epimerase
LNRHILTILGARPQFIKASALSRELRSNYSDKITESIIHTGQHRDIQMSSVFFQELGLPQPDFQLNPSRGTHGVVTGSIMGLLDPVMIELKPNIVLVYGDTNSTVAGALAAAKLNIPVVHVEAGMRSGNKRMPEEINRIVTDHVSSLNFAPSQASMGQLKREGLGDTANFSGDIMFDCLNSFTENAMVTSLESAGIPLSLLNTPYAVATFHRQENTDSESTLTQIMQGLEMVSRSLPVVLPIHPRLKLRLAEFDLLSKLGPRVLQVRPLSYFEMLKLQKNSKVIITDSGGLQKEAFYLRVPCVTVREETEWPETISLGWNRLSSIEPENIVKKVFAALDAVGDEGYPYGNGKSSAIIAGDLWNYLELIAS